MKTAFEINNVPYLSQRDNSLFKNSSCYSTSVAMVIEYIMKIDKIKKSDLGIHDGMQVEDFITEWSLSSEIRQWALNRWGSWVRSKLGGLRTFAEVEDYIFNHLMSRYSYKSTFTNKLNFKEFCDTMEKHKLPMPVKGSFPILLGGGHICCAIGFNYEAGIIVMHDPFGNAHTKYKDHDGSNMRYPVDQWFLGKGGKIFCNVIERI